MEPLSPFYRFVSSSIINLALAQNNSRLLAFLFNNKLIPLPYTNFTIKEKQYTSMVEYFVRQAEINEKLAVDTPEGSAIQATKRAAMVDCFDVLIKNSLSLLEVDSTTEEPFALPLVFAEHPLSEALNRNPSKTFNDLMFFKKLNRVFVFLNKPNIKPEKKQRINHLLDVTGLNILCLQKVNFSLVYLNYEVDKQISVKLSSNWLSAFQGDPDLIKEREILGESLEKLLSEMDTDLNLLSKVIKDAYAGMKALVDGFASPGNVLQYREFKQKILGYYKYMHKTLALVREQNDCMKVLQQKLSSKAKRIAVAKYKEIDSKLGAHSKTPVSSFEPHINQVRTVKIRKKADTTTVKESLENKSDGEAIALEHLRIDSEPSEVVLDKVADDEKDAVGEKDAESASGLLDLRHNFFSPASKATSELPAATVNLEKSS